MGFAIAEAFYLEGADVVLITGPTKEQTPYQKIKQVRVQTAAQMFTACDAEKDADIVVMSAAVADFTPARQEEKKIKKTKEDLVIQLSHTQDILQYLGTQKRPGQFIAGFALETNNEKENAVQKLKNKNLDCIILNSLQDKGAGFDLDTNKISIIDHDAVSTFGLMSKKETANRIVEYIVSHLKA
jgi:phosphopantothenoylcysteine decarboxylase/phosphopantothenate--cysteine ligase